MPADMEANLMTHLPALAENDINPAGYAGLSSWPQIALGAAPLEHKVMRAFMNARVSASAPSSLWSADRLHESASAFLASRDRIDVWSAACEWVDSELWQIILELDVLPEMARRLCDEYMMDFLVRYAVAPAWAARLPGDVFGYSRVKAEQRRYVERFEQSAVLRAHAHGDPAKAALIAHVTHDAIAFAGGRSVPGLIAKVLWVLHNGTGLAQAGLVAPVVLGVTPQQRLNREQTLRALVLEVVRLQPEVTHVPVRRDGHSILLSLEAALVDPRVWGEAPRELRLQRPVSHDVHNGPYGTAWAHAANADGGPTARGCPGMSLSLALIEGFVRAFLDEWEEWVPEGEGALRRDHTLGGTLVRRTRAAGPTAAAAAKAPDREL